MPPVGYRGAAKMVPGPAEKRPVPIPSPVSDAGVGRQRGVWGPMKARLAERKPDELEYRGNIPSDG